MIVLLSPSKAMNFDPAPLELSSMPALQDRAEELAALMRERSPESLARLMKLSEKLAALNHARFQSFGLMEQPLKQAILAFAGDTYKDIPLQRYTEQDFEHAQQTVRILSGLYGVLRPLDLIHPYRLEMGTRLETPRGKGLYAYWGDEVTRLIREAACGRPVIHCASKEYFKVVDPDALDAPVVTPIFKDSRDGTFKVISFYAKRARGMMADFIVRERLTDPADLIHFRRAGYAYDKATSTPDAPVFLRQEKTRD